MGEKVNEWDGHTDKFTEKKEESKSCDACCRCLLRSKHKLPENPTVAQRIHYSLTCPPHGKVTRSLALLHHLAQYSSGQCFLSQS